MPPRKRLSKSPTDTAYLGGQQLPVYDNAGGAFQLAYKLHCAQCGKSTIHEPRDGGQRAQCIVCDTVRAAGYCQAEDL